MTVFAAILATLQIAAGLQVLYLFTLGLAAVVGDRTMEPARAPSRGPRTRFAVLIPAHDEETVIGRAIDSISAALYPPSLVEVLVIADNCTDATVRVAREHHAECWERADPAHPGKGCALDWATKRLARIRTQADAFVVLDADTLVGSRFFAELDAEMRSRPGVLQAHYAVLNQADTALTAITTLALALQQYVKPLGRTVLGLSPRLLGNGMCFPATMLADGWHASSISEDLEHFIWLLLEGRRTRLVPAAVINAEMPASFSGAKSQRVRWEKGKLLAIRAYVPRLVREALGRHDRVLADAAADIAMPPIAVLVATLLLVGAGDLLLPGAARTAFLAVWAISVVLLGCYVVCGAVLLDIEPSLLARSALVAPAFLAWKLWIQVLAILGIRDRRWIRTPRAAEIPKRRRSDLRPTSAARE